VVPPGPGGARRWCVHAQWAAALRRPAARHIGAPSQPGTARRSETAPHKFRNTRSRADTLLMPMPSEPTSARPSRQSMDDLEFISHVRGVFVGMPSNPNRRQLVPVLRIFFMLLRISTGTADVFDLDPDRDGPSLRFTESSISRPTPMASSWSVRSDSRLAGCPFALTMTSPSSPAWSMPRSPACAAGDPGTARTTTTPSIPSRVATARSRLRCRYPGLERGRF
jgi:hypothetical protein